MRKRPEIVAFILFAALIVYGAGLNVFIIPVVQNMLGAVDAPLMWPSRAAIAISQNAGGEFLLFIALLALVLKRTKPNDDRVQQARVLNIASLMFTVFIMLQGWIFVDMALSATKIVNQGARRTASATRARAVARVRKSPSGESKSACEVFPCTGVAVR